MTTFTDEFRNFLRARYSLLQLATHEEQRALAMVAAVAKELNHELYVWSAATGVTKNGTVVADKCTDLKAALDFCEERARSKEPQLFVFLDAHALLQGNSNPLYRRRLREFAASIRTQGYRANCILVGYSTELPPELQKEITLLDFPLPDRALMRSAIAGFIDQHRGNPRIAIDVSPDTLDLLTEAALGLTLSELENCLSKALVEDLKLDAGDVRLLLREKQQAIRKSGVLDYIDAAQLALDQVGGLETLKRWLSMRGLLFSTAAKEFGLSAPKGVLLTGVPGCGKSLTAKCVASAWNLPLLKLDMGKVFQGLVGSSEANIRTALATAEAVAPAVLWIDEIEKGLAGASGGGGDSGTAVRVFGTILTWMQEKSAPVFVFATANDISSLPPELLRKGRFDEIFFVDLPGEAERIAILEIQISNCKRDPARFDMRELARLSGEHNLGEDYRLSGAELQAWVQEAMLEAFRRRAAGDAAADLSMADFEQSIKRIVPMAQMRKNDIARLRGWAGENAVSASLRDTPVTAAQSAASVSGGRILDF